MQNLPPYHNALRYSLIRQMAQIKNTARLPYSSEVGEHFQILHQILWFVESCSPADFALPEEALAYILENLPTQNVKLLKSIQQQIKQDFRQALSLPAVPARRVLSKMEWEKVWQIFEQKLKPSQKNCYLFEPDYTLDAIADFVVQEVSALYCVSYLNSHYNYELSSAWFPKLFAEEGFWIDTNFEWAIAYNGNDFVTYCGDAFSHLL